MENISGGRVNLEKARQAIERMHKKYTDNPQSSKVLLRATAKLVKDTLFEGRIGKFTFQCDEPPERGGQDLAPSPLEFFLIGAAF